MAVHLCMFTVSSLLCGIAPSLGMLLLFRVIQGAGGGGLQPMAQAILADTFPPQKRGLAFALYGITAIMAPTIGPTLGGWITDNYSWRWIFLHQSAGRHSDAVSGAAAWWKIRRIWRGSRRAGVKLDYIGIALLALGVGALQVLLDKGQEDDWFGSHFITTLVGHRGGLPDLAGDLGVVSKGARSSTCACSRASTSPVSSLMMFMLGMLAVQQPGDDAAVSADADGIHGAIGRACAFRRAAWSC